MKKIFYILASAIVALGAVACENDVMDNIATVEGDTVSFVAAIDDTKTDLTADNKTIWDEDDTIVIEWDQNGNSTIEDAEKFSFTNTAEDVNTFSCTADGLRAITEANVVATYSNKNDGNIDSEAGKAGSLLTYSGAFTELKFQVQNAFLKFTAAEDDVVTLTASAEIFSTGTELTLTATGEAQYVAILPETTTITYAINDVVCTTSKENALVAGKIYTLGALDKVVTIKTKEDLLALAEAVNNGTTYKGYTVKLANDINLEGAEWTPIGNLEAGVTKSFRGHFDGQDNTISNFTVTAPEAAGFFGAKWDGDIKNVKFDGATIKGNHYAGVIVGWADGANYNYNWSVEGCEVNNSTVTLEAELVGEKYDNGDKAGALVGYAYGINVKDNTVANTTVQGYRDLGGLVGIAQENTQTDPHSEWAVVSGNTLGENVKIVVDNTHNYQNYTIQSQYNVQPYAGRISDCSVVESNTGEATIDWGEIPAEFIPVASVNGTEYTDLGEAIAAANGETVTLIADVELEEALTVAADNVVTLDLNDKILALNNTVAGASMLNNKGTFTIKNGTVDYAYTGEPDTTYGKGNATISNTGTLVIESDAKITNSSAKMSHAAYAIDNNSINSNASLTVRGTVDFPNGVAIRQVASTARTNTVNIEEGAAVAGTRGVQISLIGSDNAVAPEVTLNITGGTLTSYGYTSGGYDYRNAIESNTQGNSFENVTINIEGENTVVNGDMAFTIDHKDNENSVETVNIKGGTFNMANYIFSYALWFEDTTLVESVQVTGGTFNKEPLTGYYGYHMPEGYVTYMDGENYVVASMQDALKVADEISVYGEIDLAKVSLSGYTGTIVGATDAAVLNTRNYTGSSNEFYPIQGSEITFKDIDIWFPTADGDFLLTGIMSRSTLTFNNCDFEGQFTLNGAGTWTFNECDFVSTEEGAYASFVYGAANTVQFNTCSFSGVDRAAKVYGTGGTLNVVYDKCTFTSDTQNKAAVNVDASYATTTVHLNNGCSQTGMGELYALVGTKGVIYIDGTQVAPIPYVAKVGETSYTSLEEAIAAANGSTIELLADAGDVTISQACTINAGTYTINITAGEGYAVVDNENGTYTVKALPKVYVCISDVAWTNVNIHLYTNSGDVTEWPGEEISTDLKTNINGKDYYEYTMPSFDTYSIVFNNGTANSNWKLEIKDIEMSEDKYFRLSARGPIVVNPNDVSTFGYAIYVFDQKSKNVAPNLYVWGDNNAFKNTYGTWNYTWGGQSFANDCYYHPADDVNWKHYYYCEIPTSLYSTGFNFIVNKTGQTGDCEPTSITSDLYVGYWYDSASSNGFWTNANMSTPITK